MEVWLFVHVCLAEGTARLVWRAGGSKVMSHTHKEDSQGVAQGGRGRETVRGESSSLSCPVVTSLLLLLLLPILAETLERGGELREMRCIVA